MLGIALFFAAAALILVKAMWNLYAAGMDQFDSRRPAAFNVLMGAVPEAMVSGSSVAAGAIGVTALLFLDSRLVTTRVAGADIAHAVLVPESGLRRSRLRMPDSGAPSRI